MAIERIVAELLGTPWAMEPVKLAAIAGVIMRKHLGGAVSWRFDDDDEEDNERRRAEREAARLEAERRALALEYSAAGGTGEVVTTKYGMRAGSVAVLNVGGVIAPRASMVNGASMPKGTSLEALRAARSEAERDPAVGSVAYRFNSPGGYASGLAEYADELAAMSGDAALGAPARGKPAWGHVEQDCCSAAFYAASALQRIESARDARVGSIGTYMVVYDEHRYAQENGVDVHLIRSPESPSSVKGVGTWGTAVTGPAKANWQNGVDALQGMFNKAVARGRKLSPEKVAELATGETWVGEQAAARGLIDGVRPFGSMLAEMSQKFPAKAGGGGGGAGGFGAAARVEGASARFVAEAVREIAAHIGVPVGMATQEGHGLEARATPEAAVASVLDGVTAQPGEAGGKVDMRLHGAASVLLAASAAAAGQEVGGNGSAAGGTGGGGDPLKFDREAAVAEGARLERARVAALESIAKPFAKVAGVAEALAAAKTDAKVDENAFRQTVMDAVAKAQQPTGLVQNAGLSVSVGTSGPERWTGAATAGLFARANMGTANLIMAGGERGDRIARAIGYADAGGFRKSYQEALDGRLVHRSLQAMAAESLRIAGKDPYSLDPDGVFSASVGQSTSEFSILLANTASMTLQASFAEQETTFQKWCGIGSNPNFKDWDRVELSEAPELETVVEGDGPKRARFNDRKFTATVGTKGKAFGLTRETFINDNLNAFLQLPRLFGAAAKRSIEKAAVAKLVANPTLPDSVALFHATHRNLLTGAALAMASLDTAIIALRNQQGFGETVPGETVGNYLNVMPRWLLTGTALSGTARMLYESKGDPTAGEANNNRPNIVQGMAEPVSTPWLTSATNWYLLADPAQYPVIEITYLNGRQLPIIQAKPMTSIFTGPEWEILFDFAANAVGFVGAQKNPV